MQVKRISSPEGVFPDYVVNECSSIALVGDLHITYRVRSRKDFYLDSILDKLSYICKSNDLVILLGDFFHTSSVSDHIKDYVVTRLKPYASKLFSIIGNHDIISYNADKNMFSRTSINLLNNIGLLKLFNSIHVNGALDIDSVSFLDYSRESIIVPKINRVDGSVKILVGHMFFNSEADSEMSLFEDNFSNSDYFDYIILGHDHAPATYLLNGKTQVIIPGSLARNTSHQYNLQRIPSYCRYDCVTGVVTIEDLSMIAKPSVDIFKDSYLDISECEDSDGRVSLENIKHQLDFINKDVSLKYDLFSALKELHAPPDVVRYLSLIKDRYTEKKEYV